MKQTYENTEVIVVDDESSDSPIEVAERYPVKYIRIKHKGAATPAHANNVGRRLCKGSFLMFLDADDIIEPNYVEECYMKFLEQVRLGRNVGFVWTGYRAFEDAEHVSIPKAGVLTRFNYNAPLGQLGAMLLPKRVCEAVGNFDDSLFGYSDWDWVIRACSKGFVGVSVREPLHHYRFHKGSLSSYASRNKQAIKALCSKHPLFRFLNFKRRWMRRIRLFCMENSRARTKLYNKTVPRLFHVARLIETCKYSAQMD